MSPWHCSVAVTTNGTFITAHKASHRESFELIKKNDRPSFFRESSPLFVWDAPVDFEHHYGQHLVVRTLDMAGQQLSDSDLDKLARLAMQHKRVTFIGT